MDFTRPKRVEVMGAPIDPMTMDETIECACRFIESGSFAHFIGVNADKYLQMKDDSFIDEIVRKCEVINADGASIVMAAHTLGIDVPERVTGIDLMIELCSKLEKENVGIYLLGAKQDIVEKTAACLFEQFPELSIVGIHNGYFEETDYSDIVKNIKDSGASVVFVGITSPKKERLIEYFRSRGLVGVFVGVGGSFDVISGEIARAPMWIQKAKLEWLFRMAKEPKRLFRRYIVGNTRFMALLAKEKLTNKRLAA
ncbi:WecB/TagA/CpsF family glycosyltransferase [Adlercreutzia sp. ZJ154]|uniref:WecB/TagA/CpsF family glycosyltransferase n=1 Tax=Adlercreutzia sp. ZJ154 TaxID=2709790 RepID=UPI0013ECEDAD|nr:WecB/TagA/CpsF family glycosyltransferase [Adlercreutzia sp. ZJ154]